MRGEKMKCEVILPRNQIRGEITKNYFYQTLSTYFMMEKLNRHQPRSHYDTNTLCFILH